MHAQPTCHLLLMNVSEAAFKPWIKGYLTSVEAILLEEIVSSMLPSHHTLADHTLVARMAETAAQINLRFQKGTFLFSLPLLPHWSHCACCCTPGTRVKGGRIFCIQPCL